MSACGHNRRFVPPSSLGPVIFDVDRFARQDNILLQVTEGRGRYAAVASGFSFITGTSTVQPPPPPPTAATRVNVNRAAAANGGRASAASRQPVPMDWQGLHVGD